MAGLFPTIEWLKNREEVLKHPGSYNNYMVYVKQAQADKTTFKCGCTDTNFKRMTNATFDSNHWDLREYVIHIIADQNCVLLLTSKSRATVIFKNYPFVSQWMGEARPITVVELEIFDKLKMYTTDPFNCYTTFCQVLSIRATDLIRIDELDARARVLENQLSSIEPPAKRRLIDTSLDEFLYQAKHEAELTEKIANLKQSNADLLECDKLLESSSKQIKELISLNEEYEADNDAKERYIKRLENFNTILSCDKSKLYKQIDEMRSTIDQLKERVLREEVPQRMMADANREIASLRGNVITLRTIISKLNPGYL